MKKQNTIIRIAAIIFLFTTASITAFGNKPIHEIPFEYELNKIIVPVTINGSKPIRSILDTGMIEGVFLMNPAAAKDLNLKYANTNVMLRGGGPGSSSASMAMGAKVTMANVSLENQRVLVMNSASPLSGLGVDSVIGASIFNKFVVEIDVIKKMIKLYDPAEFAPKEAGESIELAITRTKPYISTLVNVDGKKDVQLKLFIDTGAGLGLMLSEKSEKGFNVPAKSVEGVLGRGVGGEIRGKVARSKKLQLGKYELPNIITHFQNSPNRGADGLIGMRVLERFLVTFDYTGKRMFLKPNKNYKDPFEFSMIGVAARPDKDGAIQIVDVFEGSPADEAGIKTGDTVLSIDNKPMTFGEYAKIAQSMTTPGKKIVIEFERKGKKHKKTIQLRRIL